MIENTLYSAVYLNKSILITRKHWITHACKGALRSILILLMN